MGCVVGVVVWSCFDNVTCGEFVVVVVLALVGVWMVAGRGGWWLVVVRGGG